MSDLTKKRGAAVLSIIGSVAGGLALLIASQLFGGINKAQSDIADLRAVEAKDVGGIQKDISWIKCAIKAQSEINAKQKSISLICPE